MADLVNPYANPYLPSFVSQRPRLNEPLPTPQMNYSGINFGQIHPVNGFDGARAYANNLANGSSEIVPDSDPNVPRVYIVAKDTNGQVFLQGCNVTTIEEPKPVTMDDLSTQMNQILERLNKLEGDQKHEQQSVGKPGHELPGSGHKQPNGSGIKSGSGYGSGNAESSDRVQSGNTK